MQSLARHGWRNTFKARALKGLDDTLGVRILRGFCIERPEPAFLQCPKGFMAGFLSAGELRRYARDPEAELSAQFVKNALARGDRCYAIRDRGALAAYTWYSTATTPIGIPNLGVSCGDDYVYVYKAFTHPRYRGQRLHAIGKTQALMRYRARGYRGLVSYVEAGNLESLKSCFRMGCSAFGTIVVLRRPADSLAVSSPGCRRYEFRLERMEDLAGARQPEHPRRAFLKKVTALGVAGVALLEPAQAKGEPRREV